MIHQMIRSGLGCAEVLMQSLYAAETTLPLPPPQDSARARRTIEEPWAAAALSDETFAGPEQRARETCPKAPGTAQVPGGRRTWTVSGSDWTADAEGRWLEVGGEHPCCR